MGVSGNRIGNFDTKLILYEYKLIIYEHLTLYLGNEQCY